MQTIIEILFDIPTNKVINWHFFDASDIRNEYGIGEKNIHQ